MAGAVAGAVLSTFATILQMALVLGATSLETLHSLAAPIICAGFAAIVYGAVFTFLALRQTAETEMQSDQAFSLSTALVFAATLAIVLIASAFLQDQFGEKGVILPRPWRASPIHIQLRFRLLRLLLPENSLRLTRSCRFWPDFRPTRSAKSSSPPQAAVDDLLFAWCRDWSLCSWPLGLAAFTT